MLCSLVTFETEAKLAKRSESITRNSNDKRKGREM